MDSLPEECLLHLLSYATAAQSLHALLLTNKTLFRLVAPVLYRNPLDYIDTHLVDCPNRQQRQTKALRLLLACSPRTLHLVPAAFASPPTIDYLALYAFHSEKLLVDCLAAAFHSRPQPQLDSSPATPASPNLPQPHGSVVDRNPIHRAMVGHSPFRLHTISFSVRNLAVLQPEVANLPNLVRLELFKRSSPDSLDGARRFILDHKSLFSTLKEIQIVLSTAGAARDQSKLWSLVQAMETPAVVDVARWPNADQSFEQFPLSSCHTLLMRLGNFTSTRTSALAPDTLSSLSQLRVLRMSVFHKDMFSWAAARNPDRDPRQTNQVAHMKSLTLYGTDDILVPALTDACDGFRQSLQRLTGLSSFGDATSVYLSWSWDLLHLTRLDLEGTVAASFDLVSLRHCPVLRELRLEIGRKIPAGWNAELKATQLCNASALLKRLELSGYWGLTDRLLTETLLPLLTRLSSLNLMWCTHRSVPSYITLLSQLSSLRWLGLSATVLEKEEILDFLQINTISVDLDIHTINAEE
ncbi:hypothetical protein BGZ98_004516 [Dissophora globulifera]|nr:hypothetical protein BGZ98_004516 [Dissophora globulifera]